MGRVETGRLARVGDQSGENAGGEPEGRGSESELSGIHVPLLRGPERARVAVFKCECVGESPEGPERARVAVFKCECVGESPEEGTGEAARDDQSSAVLHADPETD